MEDDDEPICLVIDNGSGMCKAGFCTSDAPVSYFPSVIGRPHSKGLGKDFYIGDEAQAKRGLLSLSYPMEHGIVTNWDDMEKIWEHVFCNELRVSPDEHPVLLTEASLNPKADREKMTQIMFESFQVPALSIANQCILSMYASSLDSKGIILESGDGLTQVLPFYDQKACLEGIGHINLGGYDVTQSLAKGLEKKGHSIAVERVRSIKETLSYVSLDCDNETLAPRNYELPDGQVICLDKERFLCSEGLFKPYLHGKDYPGVHDLLYDSVKKCDESICRSLLENVVVCGGNTMLPGFVDRLRKEVSALAPQDTKIKLHATPARNFSVWAGGCILTSHSTFKAMLISKQDYDESGPSIAHRKCL
uniref:Actin, cytoplasmic n=1 Tax=Amphimedon queenslandica TaxID=400682 RepID=A0A1X7VVX1_AMPQE